MEWSCNNVLQTGWSQENTVTPEQSNDFHPSGILGRAHIKPIFRLGRLNVLEKMDHFLSFLYQAFKTTVNVPF